MDPTQQAPGAPAAPNPLQQQMQQALLLQAIRGAAQQQGQQGMDQAQAMGASPLGQIPVSQMGMMGSGMGAGTPPAMPVDPNTMTGGLGSAQQQMSGIGQIPVSEMGLMQQQPQSQNPVANALMSPIPGSQ